jgi:DNA repair protein RAD57
LAKSAIYISTEAALPTSRLHQMLRQNPVLSKLPAKEQPSLSQILSIQTPDLESQEHILRYQLPVAIKRQNIGLVVVDSIASNYRAEFDHNRKKDVDKTGENDKLPEGKTMADRRSQLVQLGTFLRELARSDDITIIVSNQVADRMSPILYSQPASTLGITPDPLSLDHQMCWFTGWGDHRNDLSNLKTPSLGLVWTNQISARIALTKAARSNREGKTRRWFRLVFAPWAAPTRERGIEYEITTAGIKVITKEDEKESQSEYGTESQDIIHE